MKDMIDWTMRIIWCLSGVILGYVAGIVLTIGWPDDPQDSHPVLVITVQFLTSSIFLARAGIPDVSIRQAILLGICVSALALAYLAVSLPFESAADVAIVFSPVVMIITATVFAAAAKVLNGALNRGIRHDGFPRNC